MPDVDYTAAMDVARDVVWEFVRDMNNWAPLAKGYQSHEVIDERESIWTVKGELGPISRTTKFNVVITEWVEGERVAFTLKGLNEPITGQGVIMLADGDGGTGTKIRGEGTMEMGGSMGPIVNQLIGPWFQAGADELVTSIVQALQPSYERPKERAFFLKWLDSFRALLGRLLSPAPTSAPAEAERVDYTKAAAAPSASVADDAHPTQAGASFRVEAVLLSPDADQYAGQTPVAPSIDGIASAARKAEELGFDGVTAPEAGRDPFLPLVVAAEHTERIALATNVAIAFPRSPLVVAQMAWDLQQFSAGRFRLGLGSQVKGHNERRYAAPWTGPPGPRMREYVLCLKAMFESFQNGGQSSQFSGEHYQFTLMPPFFNPGPIEHPHVPIYVAAVNTYMARLSGELCDGVRVHPIATFRYVEDVLLPAVKAGTAKAGRNAADIDVVGAPFLAVGKDEEEVEAAKKALKQRIAFYASTRTYHAVLEFHGWRDAGRKLHEMSREGKWQEMPEVISDEMLAEFAVVSTYDQLASKLKRRCGGVFSTLLLDLPAPLSDDAARVKEIVRGLHAP